MTNRIVLLSGGVGGAKLAEGLQGVLPPESLTVVANTGDDIEMFGLYVSPDVDIVTYTLAGCVHVGQGWGRADETFRALEQVKKLGGPAWFNLGDQDLGVHLFRTQLLREGIGAAEITRRICAGLGVRCRVLPMCEQSVTTRLDTDRGDLHLQEYLIMHRAEPEVHAIRFEGIETACPAPGVEEALAEADVVILAPSNPLISIAPILVVPGMIEALQSSPAVRIGVSPLVAGVSLKGPTDRMLAQLGHSVTPAGVAALYRGILHGFVVDDQDAGELEAVRALGLQSISLPSVMNDRSTKEALAQGVLDWAQVLRPVSADAAFELNTVSESKTGSRSKEKTISKKDTGQEL